MQNLKKPYGLMNWWANFFKRNVVFISDVYQKQCSFQLSSVPARKYSINL